MPQIIFIVLNKETYLEDILTAFIEAGVTGATIIDSRGMGRTIAEDVPFFDGLRQKLQHSSVNNVTVFAVVKDEATVKKVVDLVEKVVNLDEPGTGILFAMPVSFVKGLASKALSF